MSVNNDPNNSPSLYVHHKRRAPIPKGLDPVTVKHAQIEASKLVDKYDKDKNGLITQSEKEHVKDNAVAEFPNELAAKYLRSKDKNKDGKIDLYERFSWGESLKSFFEKN